MTERAFARPEGVRGPVRVAGGVADADLNDPRVAGDFDLMYADWDGQVELVEQLLLGHLPVVPGGALLDCSCGNGVAVDAGLRQGWTVTGLDGSPAMVAIAQRRTRGADLRMAGLTAIRGTVSRRFDAVISVGNALPRLAPDEVPAALAQMHSACRRGGTLMVAIRDFSRPLPSRIWRDDGVARVQARFQRQPDRTIRYVLEVQDAAGFRAHVSTLHPISPLELEGIVAEAGFAVRRSHESGGRWIVSATAV